MHKPLAIEPHLPPRPFLADRLSHFWTDLSAAALNAGLTEGDLAVLDAENIRTRVEGIAGNSPFLARLCLRNPAFLLDLVGQGPERARDRVMAELAEGPTRWASDADLMAGLRQAKQKIALLVAYADVSGLWPLEEVTGALSDFAEAALDLAAAHLIRQAILKGDLAAPEGWGDAAARPATPDICRDSGFIILGMGKLGARELNYSSDIDLIILFDNEIVPYRGKNTPQDLFVRMTRDLVRIMQELTGDGYVFRTDLRLRPDPGATPVALSVAAAEVYYQSIGLNWERAAMIKARPVAGDRAAGRGFLDRIKGFVWRRHLDYAAVQDIHAIKGQIHRHHGHREIAVAGQDVKLGRGGIREIEFFAQIHQLISGGRERPLQVSGTLPALAVLERLGKIDGACRAELEDAYRFLRAVEHRLQMIQDEQTHSIPEIDQGVAHLACFMGFASVADFSAVLLRHLENVKRNYDALLEPDHGEDEDGAVEGRIMFDAADPKLCGLLAAAKFRDVERNAALVAAWGLGRYRALRTQRARDLLRDILPHLIQAFGETSDPDGALAKFDEFLGKLPAGVQLLSLFQANPWLLRMIAEIMGIAPALAATLARRPQLLDVVLVSAAPEAQSVEALEESLRTAVAAARDYQDILDLSRIWANEQRFLIGLRILEGRISPRDAGGALTRIAEAVLRVMLDAAQQEFAVRHGVIPGGRMVVLGLGKLGGGELTYTSDLDLVIIYDAPMDAMSDGERSFSPTRYYSRLSQVYINALTALTGEGLLYEVDMRLRPSGNAGPLAVSLQTFTEYQTGEAWTWEHMALTRARPVAGDPTLAAEVADCVRRILTRPRDPEKLLLDVADMRRRLRAEFGSDSIWSVKHCKGGIVDIEFIWQYLVLRHGADNPEILSPAGADAVARLTRHGFLAPEDGDTLTEAATLLEQVQGLLRLCSDEDFSEERAPRGLAAALARAAGLADFATLRDRLERLEAEVTGVYNRLIAEPAAALADRQGSEQEL